jgi:hypothetical protein
MRHSEGTREDDGHKTKATLKQEVSFFLGTAQTAMSDVRFDNFGTNKFILITALRSATAFVLYIHTSAKLSARGRYHKIAGAPFEFPTDVVPSNSTPLIVSTRIA